MHESCRVWMWVMFRVNMDESCLVWTWMSRVWWEWMSHVWCEEWVMSRADMEGWVMFRVNMSHVACEYEWVMSRLNMSHVSCEYEWVMSRVNMNESRLVWRTSHVSCGYEGLSHVPCEYESCRVGICMSHVALEYASCLVCIWMSHVSCAYEWVMPSVKNESCVEWIWRVESGSVRIWVISRVDMYESCLGWRMSQFAWEYEWVWGGYDLLGS